MLADKRKMGEKAKGRSIVVMNEIKSVSFCDGGLTLWLMHLLLARVKVDPKY